MKRLLAILILTTAAGVTLADQMTAMKSGCMGCHQPDRATVGPAMKDIAAKLKDNADIDALVAVVKAGKPASELVWGTTPMPPSPAPEGDIRTVIEWMLTH